MFSRGSASCNNLGGASRNKGISGSIVSRHRVMEISVVTHNLGRASLNNLGRASRTSGISLRTTNDSFSFFLRHPLCSSITNGLGCSVLLSSAPQFSFIQRVTPVSYFICKWLQHIGLRKAVRGSWVELWEAEI